MSVKITTCHHVVCDGDGCGDAEFGADFIHHYDTAAEAAEQAEECGVFATADGKHYCPRCIETGKAPADVIAAVGARDEEDEATTRRVLEATS